MRGRISLGLCDVQGELGQGKKTATRLRRTLGRARQDSDKLQNSPGFDATRRRVWLWPSDVLSGTVLHTKASVYCGGRLAFVIVLSRNQDVAPFRQRDNLSFSFFSFPLLLPPSLSVSLALSSIDPCRIRKHGRIFTPVLCRSLPLCTEPCVHVDEWPTNAVSQQR
jgi:hypothetical protein